MSIMARELFIHHLIHQLLMYKKEIQCSQCSGGIRVITQVVPGIKSVSLGVWVNVGSRDEKTGFHGSTHFLEHLLFKGTKKRTAEEISTIIESSGGFVNAFTDKDMTCFHTKTIAEDLPLAVDVLSDIIKNPLLKEEAIQKEVSVIMSEIDARDDDPHDLINDLNFKTVWGDNPASYPILGERGELIELKANHIREYYNENYTPDKMLITATGNVNHNELVDLINENLIIERPSKKNNRSTPVFTFSKQFIERKTNQVQLAVSTEGLSYNNSMRDALSLINIYLGVGASSKLFQEVREKQGLVYSLYSTIYSLEDAGLFMVFAGTHDKNVENVLTIILREIKNVGENINDKVLEEIKHKSIGIITLMSENPESRMIQLGVSTLRSGKPKTVQETIDRINSVRTEDVSKVSERLLSKDLSITTLGLSKKIERKINDSL